MIVLSNFVQGPNISMPLIARWLLEVVTLQLIIVLGSLRLNSFLVDTTQVEQLTKRSIHFIAPGGLAGDRWGIVIPASGFSFSAQQIWKVIRDNNDLHLPAHKVMVAIVRYTRLPIKIPVT
ncbi:hypothetical protein MKX01_036967 [Papaver californicum]|nr:hypothetical protein MKX01_036967 [Papaver californicum]